MKPVYGYLRVSGHAQIDGDGFPRQREAIERYAAANGLEVRAFYEERGVSGATEWEARAAWVEMLDKIIHNGVRTIVIEKLDRLARGVLVQEHIIEDLKKRGVELISVAEPDLGSDDPTRVLMRQIMGAIAQYDKAMIVLKLRGARQRRKASAGRCEGQKPYGTYPGEAEVLEQIQTAARGGETPAAIARWLNEHGAKSRSGKPWHPYVVGRILKGVAK